MPTENNRKAIAVIGDILSDDADKNGYGMAELARLMNEYIKCPSRDIVGRPPKEVQKILDTFAMAIRFGLDRDDVLFDRIFGYLHGFMFNEAYNHFVIKGMEGKDIYQEASTALWQKAIPSFDPRKGMSFVNFAKICMYRHLITELNKSNTRKKDKALNTAISIDYDFNSTDDNRNDTSGTLAGMLSDNSDFIESLCSEEDKGKTIAMLRDLLSPLESSVFMCYLEKMSYREIADAISHQHGKTYDEKSVDNALLRIRAKADDMKDNESPPLFSS